MKHLIFILTLLFSSTVFSNVVYTNKGVVQKLYAYTHFGSVSGQEGADVLVVFDTGLAECPAGFFLSASAPAKETVTSFLLTAYMKQNETRFRVATNSIWNGSASSKYCELRTVIFE
ncbi:MAG: hypothetical protein HWE27_10555 [Gammaproteobacteria bacterium]|nr:hypothetical protein [Gammaproteobacteria bacterium]